MEMISSKLINLLQGLGIGVEISSGANFIGALMIQEKLGSDVVVTTIFPGDNNKHLSTDFVA